MIRHYRMGIMSMRLMYDAGVFLVEAGVVDGARKMERTV
jgi:hypothetical protein